MASHSWPMRNRSSGDAIGWRGGIGRGELAGPFVQVFRRGLAIEQPLPRLREHGTIAALARFGQSGTRAVALHPDPVPARVRGPVLRARVVFVGRHHPFSPGADLVDAPAVIRRGRQIVPLLGQQLHVY